MLSGGKGPDEPVSEAQAMYRYLVYNGVRPGQLLLEEHSVSTVENLAYSKLLIESHREMIRHEREERNHLKFSREPKRKLPYCCRQAFGSRCTYQQFPRIQSMHDRQKMGF